MLGVFQVPGMSLWIPAFSHIRLRITSARSSLAISYVLLDRCSCSRPRFGFQQSPLHTRVSPLGHTLSRPPRAPAIPFLGSNLISARLFTSEARRLLLLAKPEAKVLAGAILLLFISSGVTMSVPFSMGKIIDIVMVTIGVKVPEAAATVGAAANFGRVVLMRIAGERIVMRLRNQVFKSIISQDMSFFDKNRTGELVSRLSLDTSIVGKSVTNNISDGLRSSVSALLIMMTIVPPVALAAIWYGRLVRQLSKQTQDAISETTKFAEEKVGNIRTVRAFSREPKEMAIYSDRVKDVYDVSIKEGLATGLFFGGMGLSGNVVMLAILYYGGSMVQSGAITVGDLTSFFLYTAYVGSSFFGLSGFYSELMKGIGASSRLFELMDSSGVIESSKSGVKIEEPHGRIEFKNVSFSYPTRKDIPIFSDLMYDPAHGSITIDGYDLRSLDPAYIRDELSAFVSQEPVLFAATIRENIAYGRPTATEEDIVHAADTANARGFIEGFPGGFETFVGEKGAALSGGQKQRVAIARALIKNPKILIMDEATSALDAASENLVQDAMSRIVEGRTVITIAHRLSTIQQADVVVMIAEGKVVEIGEYDELVQREGGKFRALVETQLTN
ncbi:P-loop containing nucleoside triphosphate hydrolase protein [Chytridium lagenaria]|nr:P-loop containing nucleoside triphosphate hydrolase protein [Chytridium lagenaria]